MQKRQRGFTLIELLAVLIVISVMMVATYSVISPSSPFERLRRATGDFIHIINMGRYWAAQRNRAYEVVVEIVTGKVYLNESIDSTCQIASLPPTNGKTQVKVLNMITEYPGTLLSILQPTELTGARSGSPYDTFCIKPDGSVLRTGTYRPVSVSYGKAVAYSLVGNDIIYRITLVVDAALGNSELICADLTISYSGRVTTKFHRTCT